MKIEKRQYNGKDSVLLSHNGLTLFLNQGVSDYELRVNVREIVKEEEKWRFAGSMVLSKEELKTWIKLLGEV